MPGRKFTPRRLASAMRRYEQRWPKAVIKGFNKGLVHSHRYAITRRMTGGGKRAPSLRDKLRIRSGDLRRTVAIIKARRRGSGKFEGGLKAGSAKVRYARIHEKGGVIRARKAKYLVFRTPDGTWHSVKQVRIPARPYLEPSLKATMVMIQSEVDEALAKMAQKLLG